jgi:hypothetical protein
VADRFAALAADGAVVGIEHLGALAECLDGFAPPRPEQGSGTVATGATATAVERGRDGATPVTARPSRSMDDRLPPRARRARLAAVPN